MEGRGKRGVRAEVHGGETKEKVDGKEEKDSEAKRDKATRKDNGEDL